MLQNYFGDVSEWLKEHAWKACVRSRVPRVRIPASPPDLSCIIYQIRNIYFIANMIRLKKKLLFSIFFFLIHQCKKVIRFLNKNPLLFKTKTIHIVYFGIFAAVGVFAFSSIFVFYIDAKGYTFHYSYFIIFGIIFICLVVFNKIFHIFTIGRDFFSRPFFYLNQTAMYNQSGILAVIISLLIISFLENIPLIIALDGAAFAVVAALFFGRIGCFNFGCCFGKPSNNYFTVTYTNLNSKILRLYPELKDVAIIPTQLYSALFNLILFILFTIIIKLLPLNGSITILFIVLYNLFRIIIESYRFNNDSIKINFKKIAYFYLIIGLILIFIFNKFFINIFKITAFQYNFSIQNYILFLLKNKDALCFIILFTFLSFIYFGLHGKKLGRHFN